MKTTKKNIPTKPRWLLRKDNYQKTMYIVAAICVVILITMSSNFSLLERYYVKYLNFKEFVDINNTVYAKLEVYINQSSECNIIAEYSNITETKRFKLNQGNQEILMALPEMPHGNTKVQFFINCSIGD